MFPSVSFFLASGNGGDAGAGLVILIAFCVFIGWINRDKDKGEIVDERKTTVRRPLR